MLKYLGWKQPFCLHKFQVKRRYYTWISITFASPVILPKGKLFTLPIYHAHNMTPYSFEILVGDVGTYMFRTIFKILFLFSTEILNTSLYFETFQSLTANDG